MSKVLSVLTLCAAAHFVVGCTQERPANVVFKGGNLYDSGSETSRRVEATPVYAVKTRDLAPIESESPSPAPALGVVRRIEPQPTIHIAENTAIEPVQTREEFNQVLDSLKRSSAKSGEPITLVAIPVEKSVMNGASGQNLPLSAVPQAKPDVVAQRQWAKDASAQTKANCAMVEGFVWPVRGKLLATYGAKADGITNDGVKIAAPLGKPVGAAADGEVVYAGNELDGYGNMIILKHNNGWMTAYAHLSKIGVDLHSKVQQGQKIAEIGKTGKVSEPQLYFAVRRGQQTVNPLNYLGDDVAANF